MGRGWYRCGWGGGSSIKFCLLLNRLAQSSSTPNSQSMIPDETPNLCDKWEGRRTVAQALIHPSPVLAPLGSLSARGLVTVIMNTIPDCISSPAAK